MSRLGPHGLPLTGDKNVALTGAESAAEAGTVTVTAVQSPDVNVTGSAIAGESGTVTATGQGNVNAGVTGAAAAAESGTTLWPATTRLTPLALPSGKYGTFSERGQFVDITGKASPVQAGQVTVSTTSSSQPQQIGPHILPTVSRSFSKQPSSEANAPITGAEIQGQWNTPIIADNSVTIDGGAIAVLTKAVTADADNDESVPITGAEASADAGSVTAGGSIDAAATGAEISGDAGEVQGFGIGGTFTTITGAEIGADAGSSTPAYDWAQIVTGAKIDVQGSEVGLDTNFDVSVTIYTGVINAQAGTVSAPLGQEITGVPGGRSSNRPRPRTRRRRYYVEIDGQYFVAYSQQEAIALLNQAAETVEQQPEQITKRPVIQVRTASKQPTRSKKIVAAVDQVRKRVNRAIAEERKRREQQLKTDMEIAELLQQQIAAEQQDEEDALLALLLT